MRHLRGDITVLYVDCINVNIMVVLLYHNFTKCYFWGKVVKDMRDLSVLFLTTACEFVMISKQKCLFLNIPQKWNGMECG